MKYLNITGKDLMLPGIGKIKAGGVIETDEAFNNSNFIKVENIKMPEMVEKKPKKKNN